MLNRFLMVVCCALLLRPVIAHGHPAEELNFLQALTDFQQIRSMLPSYVNGRAAALLRERSAEIGRISTKDGVEKRRTYTRKKMIEALGGLPERTPLNARTMAVLDRQDYKIEKVIFESQPRFYVTANLYLPKNGKPPYPGILFPLGHEEGAKAHSAWQQVLVSLAKKGFAALAWDTLGQGERVQLYDPDFGESKLLRSTTEHTVMGIQCLLIGDSLARYTIWDGMRALDYLVSRPEVDATRIGCTGNSGGGTHTAYLSALDDRIKVAAPSCFLTSWRRLLETIGPQDAEQCLPPWLENGLDHPDFVHAFAPKPYLILSAVRDFFSIAGARETYAEAKRLYGVMGAPEQLNMVEADDGHGYTKPRRLAAYRWFSRWLKGAEDIEPEPEVTIASESDLWCTQSGQVATELGGETVFTLNEKRVERLLPKRAEWSSQAQLESYRKEIEKETRRLIGIGATGKSTGSQPVPVSGFGVIERPGYRIEKLIYESEPGIKVPALLFVPRGPEGRKPALVYVHGRGKAADAGGGGDIEQLVRGGHIVLSVDARGMGETRQSADSDDFFRYFGIFESAMTTLLTGNPLVGMRALDIQCGVDLLASRTDVDPQRISAVGKEKGAVPTLFAALLDTRIKKLALEGMLVSYQSAVHHKIHRGLFEDVIVGVLKSFDLPDLVATMSPRPVWIVNGTDPLGHRVDQGELQKQYATAQKSFKLAGAEGSLKISPRLTEGSFTETYGEWMKLQ
jgi:cephalosporin-C deacetylase-like acetyl esterase